VPAEGEESFTLNITWLSRCGGKLRSGPGPKQQWFFNALSVITQTSQTVIGNHSRTSAAVPDFWGRVVFEASARGFAKHRGIKVGGEGVLEVSCKLDGGCKQEVAFAS